MHGNSTAVILEHESRERILTLRHAKARYAIVYDGQLFSVEHYSRGMRFYNKMTYAKRHMAERSAADYNRLFNTDKFTVAELTIKI